MDALFGGFGGDKKEDKKSDSTSHAEATNTEGGANHTKPSKGELLASAKVVANAAFGKEKNVDKAKVAGAAEDLLEAAEEYGKLGDTGYGKYVDKAEAYLHTYNEATGHDPPKAGDAKPAAGSGKESDKESKKSDDKHEGGGMGDVMKMAGGFFK